MAAASLKQTKMTVLLSINAAAIVLAGVLIAGAIWLNGGMDFRVVAERTDEIADVVEEPAEAVEAEAEEAVEAEAEEVVEEAAAEAEEAAEEAVAEAEEAAEAAEEATEEAAE